MIDKSEIKEVNGYKLVSRFMLEDSDLSLKAKGIMCLLFCLPEDFKPNIKGLCYFTSDGEKAMSSGIKELKEKCYLEVKPIHGNDGKIIEWNYKPYMHPYDISDEEAYRRIYNEFNSEDGETKIRTEKFPVCVQYNYYILTDHSLSLTAKGLLAYMFSIDERSIKEGKWHFSERGLAARNKDGRKSISTAIHELIDKQYLYTDQSVGPDGKKGHMIYQFDKKPFEKEPKPECQNGTTAEKKQTKKNTEPQNQATDNQATDNPSAENGRLETGWQKNGRVENGRQENEGLINYNETKSKTVNYQAENHSVTKSSSEYNKANATVSTNGRTPADREVMKRKLKEKLAPLEKDVMIHKPTLRFFTQFILNAYCSESEKITIGKKSYYCDTIIENFESLDVEAVGKLVRTVHAKNPTVPAAFVYSILTYGFADYVDKSDKTSYDIDRYTRNSYLDKLEYKKRDQPDNLDEVKKNPESKYLTFELDGYTFRASKDDPDVLLIGFSDNFKIMKTKIAESHNRSYRIVNGL